MSVPLLHNKTGTHEMSPRPSHRDVHSPFLFQEAYLSLSTDRISGHTSMEDKYTGLIITAH